MADERGQRVVTVTREALCSAVFRDGPAREVELPDDVEIEELWHHPNGYGYRVRISSAEWDVLPEGADIPEVNPTIHEVHE